MGDLVKPDPLTEMSGMNLVHHKLGSVGTHKKGNYLARNTESTLCENK